MLGTEILITFFVIGIMFILLMFNWYNAEIIIFSAVMVFVWTDVITVSEAFMGFTNSATLTIASLFVIMAAIQQHSPFSKMTDIVFGKKQTLHGGLSRMMWVTASFSSFMNNTPLVVLLTPVVKKWCRTHSIKPSKLLIPLSYAAIIGGMCTLIGTSTNLVVHTLLLKQGYEGFSLFELAYIGIPVFFLAFFYMIFFGVRLLPDLPAAYDDKEEQLHFIMEAKVSEGFPFIGRTIKEAGLRTLNRCYLMAIMREGECLFPVTPQHILHPSDRLLFVGDTEGQEELKQMNGLEFDELAHPSMQFESEYELVEAVIPQHSEFISNRIRELNFRAQYGGVVVAVYRNGNRINEKIGTIRLKAGDMLYILIPATPSLPIYTTGNLVIISNHSSSNGSTLKDWIPVLAFGGMISSVIFGFLDISLAAISTVLLLLLFRSITFEKAKEAIKWEVLFIIAGSFGIANALTNSGAADYMANHFLITLGKFGPIALLIAAYLMTNFLTELVTNNAAAAMVFPIIMSLVHDFSVNPEPFAVAIAIAASASFSTPIGYQTNLLVYSSGQYRFIDFLKVGLPLNLICFATAIIIIPFIWPLT